VSPQPTPESPTGSARDTLRQIFAVFFTIKSSGFGVPIAVSLLLSIAPIILLYQQNTLIALQGRVVDNQTQLMRLQTLAAQSEQARQLYLDITAIIKVVAQLEAAGRVYEKVRTLQVKVAGREQQVGGVTPPEFDQTVVAKDYTLDLCGPTFPSSLRPEGWRESKCKTTDPVSVLMKLHSFEFESDIYGKTVLALISYLEEISLLDRDALNGPPGLSENEADYKNNIPNILVGAAAICRVDPNEAAQALVRARGLKIVENSAQQLGWLFEFGFAGDDKESSDIDRAKWLKDNFDETSKKFSLSVYDLVNSSGVVPERRSNLSELEIAIASNLAKLNADIKEFLAACIAVRDNDQLILNELDPTKKSPLHSSQ